MRISDLSSDVCSSDLKEDCLVKLAYEHDVPIFCPAFTDSSAGFGLVKHQVDAMKRGGHYMTLDSIADFRELTDIKIKAGVTGLLMVGGGVPKNFIQDRSEEHTSELQSLMRISYAVFCLKKKKQQHIKHRTEKNTHHTKNDTQR